MYEYDPAEEVFEVAMRRHDKEVNLAHHRYLANPVKWAKDKLKGWFK